MPGPIATLLHALLSALAALVPQPRPIPVRVTRRGTRR